MTHDYVDLDPARLRAFDEYEHANPPESGIGAVTKTPRRGTHPEFWARIALQRTERTTVGP